MARGLDRAGLTPLALRMLGQSWWPWPRLTVLLYHRVEEPDAIGELDPHMVDATPAEFDTQMGILARYFTPVTVDQIIEARHGGSLPSNAAIVTFDDGYRDNYRNAVPILKRHGMNAVFFVTTDYVTERRLFWWEMIHVVVRRSTRGEITLTYPFPCAFPLRGDAARDEAIKKVIRIVKSSYAMDLPRFLEELCRGCGVTWSRKEDEEEAERSILTWDDVRALRAAGMDVQSHTRTHRVLGTLPDEAFENELAGSKRELEERIDAPVRSISYPVGKSIATEPRIRQALARAGYELGFTSSPGLVRMNGHEDCLDLKRIPIDRGISAATFRGALALPWLAG
ncbi:MAG TPA: polysaccharide deacetylase family protein [Polyangia bacterium]|nr:polysaccharide deacetylase family protein [Polyangia bacterium]